MIGEQATLGDALKEQGMAAADGAADLVWRAAVDDAILTLAVTGGEFTAEDVRAIAGDPPDHPNALGARFSSAAKRGEIVRVGFRIATRASRHSHPIAVWRGG